MENQNQQPINQAAQGQQVALHKRHFKPFWPILIIVVTSALIGGSTVWFAFNTSLNDEISSLLPGKIVVHKKLGSSQTDLKGWQTYTNKEYGFEFKYPSKLFVKSEKNILFEVQSTSLPLELGGKLSPQAENGIEGKDFITNGYQIYVTVLDSKESDAGMNSNDMVTPLNIPGIDATRYDATDEITRGPGVLIKNPKNPEKYIAFGYASSCAEPNCEVESVFNQILSTFKFTEPYNLQSNLQCDSSVTIYFGALKVLANCVEILPKGGVLDDRVEKIIEDAGGIAYYKYQVGESFYWQVTLKKDGQNNTQTIKDAIARFKNYPEIESAGAVAIAQAMGH